MSVDATVGSRLIESAVHVAALLLLPPLVPGVIGRIKAWLAGRKGPPLLQGYADIARLLRKGAVYSRTTTWVFRAGPIIGLAGVLAAGLLVPFTSTRAPLSFEGDVIAFAGLLAAARFFTILAALDTGSSFEGMGASREAAFSALCEATLFLCLAILCFPAGSPSLEKAFQSIREGSLPFGYAPLVATVTALFAVLLAEGSRLPVDDPGTHLELTMIHEVMVLDHGGPDLAMILYGNAMKLCVIGSLIVHAVLPFPPGDPVRGVLLMLAGIVVLAVVIGVVEGTSSRLRLTRVPQFLIGAFAIAAVGLAAIAFGGGQ